MPLDVPSLDVKMHDLSSSAGSVRDRAFVQKTNPSGSDKVSEQDHVL